jgi:hypothetical protein
MALTAQKAQTLTEHAARAVDESPTLDKAIAHLAGVLYPIFFLERVGLTMQLPNGSHLILAAVWTRRLSRVGKGTTLRSITTPFPELLRERRVVCSSDTAKVAAAEIIQEEGVGAWACIPIPHPEKIEGMLSLWTSTDVLSKQRAFLAELGLAVGPRLVELARQSPVVLGALEARL